jgi:hypothetical protein
MHITPTGRQTHRGPAGLVCFGLGFRVLTLQPRPRLRVYYAERR